MFKKILIANRGEIACRVAATARRMAIGTVAVYSDADAQAKHVAACDEAVHIGANAPKESYLRWERIIEAAQRTGAEAIHPGYGFLSENEDFAQACHAAGLVFIGPPASAIQAMGLKAESKRLMEKAGVPLVPGYHGAEQDAALLKTQATRIGYPVLIKASAGGGGKGMRAVEREADFDAALASCKREAINSFGDDAVLIEKYVQRPRHIEIQVFGDTHGEVVYLFERDCSVQRRHQKVLEEAPAPGLTPELRRQMGEAAVAAAKAVGYVGAGTVEFIVEQRDGGAMNFFFMEMNTRLQVEHPVTEAITGLDLVEWQLRVASGEPLPLRQDQLRIRGHAIEARICAENPDNNFLPATGTLAVYRTPDCVEFALPASAAPPALLPLPLGEGGGEGTGEGSSSSAPTTNKPRLDAGVRQGDTISPHYDSMIAKLIVHGDTREQALSRLDAALAQTHIVGLATNVQFLRRVIASRSFSQADLDTALIPREAAVLFNQQPVSLALAVAASVARTLLNEAAQAGADPFSRRDGWRAYGVASRSFAFEWSGEPVQAELNYLHDGALQLSVPGDGGASGVLSFELRNGAHGEPGMSSKAGKPGKPGMSGMQSERSEHGVIDLQFAGLRERVQVYAHGDTHHVFANRGAAVIQRVDRLAHAGEGAVEGGRLSAPMPGKVVSFSVKVGDVVKKGQALAVLEAMKMEHTIAAPDDGTVAELVYAPGDQVAEGAELLKLAKAL